MKDSFVTFCRKKTIKEANCQFLFVKKTLRARKVVKLNC